MKICFLRLKVSLSRRSTRKKKSLRRNLNLTFSKTMMLILAKRLSNQLKHLRKVLTINRLLLKVKMVILKLTRIVCIQVLNLIQTLVHIYQNWKAILSQPQLSNKSKKSKKPKSRKSSIRKR